MHNTDLGLSLSTKRTCTYEFLVQMERVVLWAAPVALVEPRAPQGTTGLLPFSRQTMLRIHFM